MSDINSAILERLEKVVDTLQENSVKMGQLLANIMKNLTNKIRWMKSCLKRSTGYMPTLIVIPMQSKGVRA